MTARILRATTIAGSLILVTASVGAQERDPGAGGYVGIGAGQTSVDIDRLNFPGVVETVDDEDTGWKVFGGYNFNQHFAIEVAYVDLGEFSQTLDDGIDRLEGKVEGDALVFLGIGKIPVGPVGAFYGKFGLARWDVEATANVSGSTFGTLSGSEDGIDPVLGLGFQFDFGAVGLRAEWERYLDLGDEDVTGESDLDYLGLAALFKF